MENSEVPVRVIMSVSVPNRKSIDLELPVELSSVELTTLILNALDVVPAGKVSTLLKIDPGGINVGPEQSLWDVGVTDGMSLTLLYRKPKAPTSAVLVSQVERYPLLASYIYLGRLSQIPDFAEERPRSAVVDLSHEPDGRTVSRVHAILTQTADGWSIEHFSQASNPTWVNGHELASGEARRLAYGDEIRLGDIDLLLESE